VTGVAVYIPDSWIVTQIDPGQFAILQSYPEDKYVGGEGFQPGDSKCDLAIRPPEVSETEVIQGIRTESITTILSENEIVLGSGQPGVRLEVDSLGRANTLITTVNERVVLLTCFGELEPFDEIAGTIGSWDIASAPPDSESPSGEETVTAVVILAEAGLNLRTGPTLDSEVVGILPQNEIVPVTGASPDGEWWQVVCPEGTAGECWITADPRWSEPAALLEYSLAGLIYSQLDEESERPLWLIGTDETPSLFQENSQNVGALSPDGTQSIPGSPPRGETNLSLVDLTTGETRQLTATADRYNFNPQWWAANPDTIIFVSITVIPDTLTQPGPGNLAAVQTDGSGFVVLDEEHELYTFQPALAPDGLRIAYNHGGETAEEDGLFEPWVYHLEEGATPFDYAAYGLSEYPGLSFGAAAWSPDGRYLAWVIGGELTGAADWETGIAMFDLEGQRVELLTPYAPEGCIFVTCYEAPLWNPTGEWLTWYVTPAGGLPNFWILRPDGTDAQFIDFAGGPIWSPPGDLLVYSQNTSFTTSVIMVMETGQWRPQRTGLPPQAGIFDWVKLTE
jgi:Tol biopolymer transport system component